MAKINDNNSNSNGFTLIEVMVAATIVALLSTVGVTGYQAVSRSGRDALRKTDLEQLRSALEIYKSEKGLYPDETGENSCIADLSSSYINPYPSDPKSGSYKYCYVKTSALTYELCGHLENGSSSDSCSDREKACIDNCNYKVVNP